MKRFKVNVGGLSFNVKAVDSKSAVNAVKKHLAVRDAANIDAKHLAEYGWLLEDTRLSSDLYWNAVDKFAGKFSDKAAFIQAVKNELSSQIKGVTTKARAEFEKLINSANKNVEAAIKELPTAKLDWDRVLKK